MSKASTRGRAYPAAGDEVCRGNDRAGNDLRSVAVPQNDDSLPAAGLGAVVETVREEHCLCRQIGSKGLERELAHGFDAGGIEFQSAEPRRASGSSQRSDRNTGVSTREPTRPHFLRLQASP